MSPIKFIMKIYSITNLMILILYYECWYFLYINLVKVQIAWLLKKWESHTFTDGWRREYILPIFYASNPVVCTCSQHTTSLQRVHAEERVQHTYLREYIKLHLTTLHAQYIMWHLLTLDTKLHVVDIIHVCNIFF
jgi:hypothetical protein